MSRKYDPEGDLQGTFPVSETISKATKNAIKQERIKRDQAKRLETFIKGDYGFVPDSRGSITVAVENIHAQINDKYNFTPAETDPKKSADGKKIAVVGNFYKSLRARISFTRQDLGDLAEANSPIDAKHYDPTTFDVRNLKSNQRAMEAVALHQLRASALVTEDWSKLDSDVREKSIADEVAFMSSIEDEEARDKQLGIRWHAAWESSVNELKFWEQRLGEAALNVHVQTYLNYHEN